ncbi:MAG: hypothetical protein V4688_07455 [Pseudomonadota bacterium]
MTTMTALEAAQQISDMKKQIAQLDTLKTELMERLAYMKVLSIIFFGETDAQ